MSGGRSDAVDRSLSVREAASALGCSPQTVRNLLQDGQLLGARVSRGRRHGIHRVFIRSVEAYIAEHDRFPSRKSHREDSADKRVAELDARLRALEDSRSAAEPDEMNLVYANLRLMQIHEEYDRAMEDLLAANDHHRRALDAMRKVAADYRAVVEQFHLPRRPPT